MKLIPRIVSLMLPLGLIGSLHAAEPERVIFDTDITGDVDDVLALAMLHTLEDRGKCQLLAVTISKENALAAPFVDAVNTFYGQPDLPIGISKTAPHRDSKYLKLAEEKDGDALRYPRDIGVSAEPEEAVSLLRKTLVAQPDGSVTIIQVGLATNLADLLSSKADDLSPLDGPALIRKKVKRASIMAGSLETIGDNNHYLEANVKNHVPSMQQLAAEWPNEVPIIWSGFEIGIAVPYPRESIANDFGYVEHHPVKEAYLLHSGPNHDRPTWDLTSVLYAVFPEREFFGLSGSGRVTVEDDGFTRFQPAKQGRDRFLTLSDEQAARVREALVQLVVQPPKKLP
ncbi:MAG: nucleoside hydrolase [Verrucomicrobiae bacterium]|nr:nucleoside hydrolase [Verrucomicrobiae bacterium]